MFFQAFNIPRKWKFLEAEIKWKWKCLEAQVLDPCDSLPEVLWPRAGDIYLGDQTLEKTLHVRNRKGFNTSLAKLQPTKVAKLGFDWIERKIWISSFFLIIVTTTTIAIEATGCSCASHHHHCHHHLCHHLCHHRHHPHPHHHDDDRGCWLLTCPATTSGLCNFCLVCCSYCSNHQHRDHHHHYLQQLLQRDWGIYFTAWDAIEMQFKISF